MTWEGRIKAALHGDVKGSDVTALLAATDPLSGLRQQLEDRRLAAQLEHADREWLVAFELGSVAAPLWLAEALVGIASSFVEAEAEQHPDRPADMSPALHDQCLALLYPAGPIIGELSAMLADQARRFPFALPATFAAGSLTLTSIPLPLPAPYLRGLLRAAERTQGAAQGATNTIATLAQSATTPAWLNAALQRLGGESAAAATRLEMAQVNATALLHGNSAQDETAVQLANDVWSVVDTYLRIGQQVSNPLLLPGAPAPRGTAVPASGAPTLQPGAVPAAPPQSPSPPFGYPAPAPAPESPAIQEPAPSQRSYEAPPGPPAYASGPSLSAPAPAPEPGRPMPRIGGWPAAEAGPAAPRHDAPHAVEAPHEAPHAVEAPHEAPHAVEAPHEAPRTVEAHPLPRIAPEALPQRATQASAALPQIGASPGVAEATPAPATAGAPQAAQRIGHDARWMFSTPELRHQLRTAGREDEAERALAAFWEGRSWAVSLAEQAYLDEVAALQSRGAIAPDQTGAGAAPFAPRYRVAAPEVVVRGQRIAAGRSFSYDFIHGGVRVF